MMARVDNGCKRILRIRSIRLALGLLMLALAALVAGCDLWAVLQPPVVEANLQEVFQLALGQTAQLRPADLSITFQAVIEDSRCPVNLQCIWAGNATVTLEVVQANKEKQTLTLNSTIEPHVADLGNFRFHFEDLQPQPRADQTIHPGDYRLSLSITPISSQ